MRVGNRGFEGLKSVLALVVLCASLQACDTAPKTPVGQRPVGAEAFNQAMTEGNAAVQAGDPTKAHAAFDQAAKVDPASKQPWLRKAQIALDASDFGLAIQAAQEASQRDNADVTAKSIIAVSGLRAASQALRSLRQNNAVNVSTRGEAEALARTIREALGEDTLVPVAPVRAVRLPARVTPAHAPVAAAPSAAGAAAIAAPARATPAAPPAAAAKRANDPFGTLKSGN